MLGISLYVKLMSCLELELAQVSNKRVMCNNAARRWLSENVNLTAEEASSMTLQN